MFEIHSIDGTEKTDEENVGDCYLHAVDYDWYLSKTENQTHQLYYALESSMMY